jgi:predicted nucleotidyltransferase
MHAIVEQHLPKLLELCKKYNVRRLDVIGSAARNDFDPDRSDVDFVVEFNDFNVSNAADRFLGLMIDLEDLLQRRIDLVSYRAIRNPYFKQMVDQTRVNLYAA